VAELDTDRLETDAANNPGLALGAALGELALAGRDKLTLVLGESLEALGPWVEQLIAESTGKQGRGILPVNDEPLTEPARYGADRVFVAVYEGALPPPHAHRLDALEAAGHPVLSWRRGALAELGAEFARWEVATAGAGHVIGVDPFDEPNVAEAKQATQQVLGDFLERGHFEEPAPLASFGGLTVYAPDDFGRALQAEMKPGDDPCDWVCALMRQLRPGDYFAILAWFAHTSRRQELLQRIRLAVRDRQGVATTLGYGPRYLHSTGQLHKGGPDSGVFLQLSSTKDEQPIPGERYGFKAVHRAQCLGDFLALGRRGRRVMRVHMSGGIEHGLETLLDALRS
jgi:transaldolase/glucose-6-phosphate isomerase